jgi:hypothetical protein
MVVINQRGAKWRRKRRAGKPKLISMLHHRPNLSCHCSIRSYKSWKSIRIYTTSSSPKNIWTSFRTQSNGWRSRSKCPKNCARVLMIFRSWRARKRCSNESWNCRALQWGCLNWSIEVWNGGNQRSYSWTHRKSKNYLMSGTNNCARRWKSIG